MAVRMPSSVVALAVVSFFLFHLQAAPLVEDGNNSASASAAVEQPEAPPPVTCPAGIPIGPVELEVLSAGNADPLPFQTIIHLSEGDRVIYKPVYRGKEKRNGEVALVMIPEKRAVDGLPLLVTEPKPASKDEEWTVPQSISLAAFIYGPGGLSKKKVEGFLSQDDQLVAQLADYAAKTSETEALLEALSENTSAAGMNAALSGFASQYGLAVQIDKTAPPAVQAQTLFSTMNPQLATYNPLASSTGERVGQTASLATAAATLFFGSPIGIAAGGTAMLLDLRYIAFPGTVFRSSFAIPLPNRTGLNLCGQRGPLPPHTRVAYIWSTRIPNAPTPVIAIKDSNYIPQTMKTAVPVDVPEREWKVLQRARKWTMVSDTGAKTSVPVTKLGNEKSLELALDKVNLAQGDYKLTGFWDWTPFEAKGLIHVRPLSDFKTAQLQPSSQNELLAHAGKLAVTLTGSDFEFTNKVELRKAHDEFAVPEPVRFLLPVGANKGPQDKMDVQIDTANLDPGQYQLFLSQEGTKAKPVQLAILPNPPRIDNLPVLLNQGANTQHFVLKGERLQLLSKLESNIASLQLAETSASGTERNLVVTLKDAAKTGTTDSLNAYLTDRTEPITLPDALKITGPLPVIASSRLSLPNGMAVSLLPEEFPAGYTLTALLDVKNIQPKSTLHLFCSEDVGAHPALHIGEQNETSSLQQLSPDQLFLSDDTNGFPAGCTLLSQIDNGSGGKSQPVELAHLRRFPQVSSFTPTTAIPSPSSTPGVTLRNYELRGMNLEMIEKVGWDVNQGQPVLNLPTPIPGQGQQQSLVIELPEPPSSKTPLYMWLRGESAARSTTILLSAATK